MEGQREERVWQEAQISSLSIWEPVTEWSGDGELGQIIVSESETPGREPGGEVKDRQTSESRAPKRNWGWRSPWKSEEGVEDRALRGSSVQPESGQGEKSRVPLDILGSASLSITIT